MSYMGHKTKTVEQKFNEFWRRLSKDNKMLPAQIVGDGGSMPTMVMWEIVKESFAAGYEEGYDRGMAAGREDM